MVGVAMPVTVPQMSFRLGDGSTLVMNKASLYVGDLDPSVDNRQLYELFSQVAEVVSIRIIRDHTNHSSLCYAYVNFKTQNDATNAREVLNFTPINGRPIRIMFSHRDPTLRKTGYANVFIKNLDASIDSKGLHDTFSSFGNILSCKVALDRNGKHKGYGFIQFDNEESAHNAISRLNRKFLNKKKVYVGLFVHQQERLKTTKSQKFTNVYVKNLPMTTTAKDLQESFGKYGTITSAIVMTDGDGKSRCFAFINFKNPEDAGSAVENMNATSLSDNVLYVGKAQRKVEREAELKAKHEQQKLARFEKTKATNLYMKNLCNDMTKGKLRDLFSQFGTITSCKVLLDSEGVSKGVGFVAFSSPEEAKRALNEMDGKMIGKKPLYVGIAQCKDERKARLQAYFVQRQSQHARLSGYHYPGAYVYPGLVQPQGYGYQQQAPGFPPGHIMPYQLQHRGQPNSHPQPVNIAPTRYMINGYIDPTMQLPSTSLGTSSTSGLPAVDVQYLGSEDIMHSGPMATLATAIACASPENQQRILGEQLYPLVQLLIPEHARNITSMLLDMEISELIQLIESLDALSKKVYEAWEMLLASSSEKEKEAS